MAGCTAFKLQRSVCFKVHSVNLNSSIALVIFSHVNIDVVVHAVNATTALQSTLPESRICFLTVAGLIDLNKKILLQCKTLETLL